MAGLMGYDAPLHEGGEMEDGGCKETYPGNDYLEKRI